MEEENQDFRTWGVLQPTSQAGMISKISFGKDHACYWKWQGRQG